MTMTVRMLSAVIVLGAAATLPGCGHSPTSPSPVSYENVAGAYTGHVAGQSQGVSMAGTYSVNLQQSDASLSGDYSIMGTLSDGVSQTTTLQGGGPVSGTVASGATPRSISPSPRRSARV